MAHERDRREQPAHGTSSFPAEHLSSPFQRPPSPWHWHEDWEYILCTANQVRCATTQGGHPPGPGLCPAAGARGGPQISPAGERCAIRSLVFHPRFLAAGDSVIWEKYVAPLQSLKAVKLHPDVPWQWDCMHHFCVAWHAMDQREPGYEIQTRQALENAAFALSRQTELLQAGGSDKARRDSRRLEQMLRFIQEHYQRSSPWPRSPPAPLSVRASACGVSAAACTPRPAAFSETTACRRPRPCCSPPRRPPPASPRPAAFTTRPTFPSSSGKPAGAAPTEYRRRRPA